MDEADINAMLQEVARSLPSAPQQDTETSGEEIDCGMEGEEGLTVFSRSKHLQSLGLGDSLFPNDCPNKERQVCGRESSGLRREMTDGIEDDSTKDDTRETASKTQHRTRTGIHGTETDVHGTRKDPGDTEWDQFRSDFMRQLHSSSHEVKLEAGDPLAVKQHLMMKAVSELQHTEQLTTVSCQCTSDTSSEQQGPNDEQHTRNTSDSLLKQCTSDTSSLSTNQQGSKVTHGITGISSRSTGNTNSRVSGLLSSSVLDGIEMSDLDRALEEIEVGGANGATDQRSIGQHPLPKIAWEESDECGTPDIISQLTAISKGVHVHSRQQAEHQVSVSGQNKGREVNKPATVVMNEHDDEKGKKTVHSDLRPPHHHEPDNERVPHINTNHLRQSTSESEESDDQQSWARKRREIKSALSPPDHNLHRTHRTGEATEQTTHTTQSTEIQHEPSVDAGTGEPKERTTERKQNEERSSCTEKNRTSNCKKDRCTTAGVNGVPMQDCSALQDVSRGLRDVEPCIDNPPPTSPDSVPPHGEPASNNHDVAVTEAKLKPPHKGMNHSTESLTLSSEQSIFSEGELSPTKPTRLVMEISPCMTNSQTRISSKSEKKKSKKKRKGGAGKGEQKEVAEAPDSSPEVGRVDLAVSQERGGGKKSKGRKRKDGVRKTEQAKKIAKKTSIARIRLDSLTASSDEERGIDSPRLSQVEEVVEPLPERGEESKERLRLRLEHKILSKKPPTMFETPATEPLFHKDVSFSSVLSHVHSSISTDALLMLPLSPSLGLVSLPTSHPHISPEAHLALHSLLLTYLAMSAARCSVPSSTVGRTGRFSPLHTLSKLPLRITALFQTILNGQLAILVGVSLPQGRKRSMSYPSVVHCSTKKSTGSSGTILSPLDAPRNPAAVELDDVLHGLKLRDMLGDVMEDIVTEQPEDTTGVNISTDTLNEIQPLLDMSVQAFLSVHPDTDPLTTPTSFYWHSLYQSSCLPSSEALCTAQALQSTVCALPSDSLAKPSVVFHAIHGAYAFGLSIAGMRLVYGEPCVPLDLPAHSGDEDTITDFTAALVLCLRGPDAVNQCMDLVGPQDYSLAKVTDPNSIMALYGRPQHHPMQCTRTPFRAHAALSKWFGGRACLCTGSVLGMTDSRTRSERRKRQRVRFSESDFESEDNLPPPTPNISFPPLVANRPLLTVLPYEQVLVVVSPLLPPVCYSSVLATCGRLGFDIAGAKRVRLNSKRATVLDISASFVSHFTPSSTPPSPDFASFPSSHPLSTDPPLNIPPLPSLLLIVCRENALVHSCALKTAIIADLKSLLTVNPQLEDRVVLDLPMGALLHAVPYSAEKLKLLGSFAATTIKSVSCLPRLAPEWQREGERYGEEISFLAVTQSSGLARVVDVLQRVFGVKTETQWDKESVHTEECDIETQNLGGFELLGIKLIPQLSRFHAKQLCPIPSSDHAHQEALELLSNAPAIILVVRGISCNHRLKRLLVPGVTSRCFSSRQPLSSLSLITSNSLSQAFHFTTMFFTDKELFCDPVSWPLLSAVPSAWARADVLCDYRKPPQLLYSVLVVRGGQWRLLVKVVERLCRVGFQVCGVTMRSEEEGTETPEFTSGRVCLEVAVCVSRQNAVWYLNHELKPFLSSTTRQNTLHSPTTFSDAVALVHQFFPTGVCGPDGAVATEYGVKPRLIDDFSGLRGGLSTPPPTTSPLTESTCVILPPSHLAPPLHHPSPHYLRLLELLVLTGFSVTGVQMTHFSQSSVSSLSKLGVDCKELTSGPCLILLLQRDNAASCFHHILKSASRYSDRGITACSDVDELLGEALIPDSPKTAAAIVTALFKDGPNDTHHAERV